MTTLIPSDPALIETLLTNSDFLALPNTPTQPLITSFEGLGQHGLTALFTSSDSNAQIINRTTNFVVVKGSDKFIKGQWRGGIEVPQNGSYRFYAKLGKKDATVSLFFEGILEPILNGKAAQDNDEISEFIELKAGQLYALILEANNLQEGAFELMVKGEITPKDKLNQFVLLPQSEIDQSTNAYIMLNKTLQFIQALSLNVRDISHILRNPADFANVNLRLLPTSLVSSVEDNEADANTIALFKAFVGLTGYSALKNDMAGGSDDLIAIFEHARIKNPGTTQELCNRIAELTRRKPETVQSIADELKMTNPEHFADLSRMERLWRSLQIVEKFGISKLSLKSWLTPQPDSVVAKSIRNTIKSRYERETWQRIAKGIFDPLRQRQRDALVAYILHIKEDEGLVSVEKLFEYFLIDPGMEPVVQTSRLRLAISSLQTFIQRCFLNLEKQVHPSVLNTQHWSWMKRYRAWEANRKIFLFPENWLEPEWRDDKTHLYQELESSLLQGDVSNQLVEDALYVYLKKLDQLARLEIVTMYAEEKSFGPPTMHVIGRTYLSPHQYFYRSYSRQMWTAWEPVTTEIDGDHIVAVIWRERLHLFWLTFMEKVMESADGPETTEKKALGELGLDKLVAASTASSTAATIRTLEVQLNWSEYFQGEWSVRCSSGFSSAQRLFNAFAAKPFDTSTISIAVSKESDPATGAEGVVWITLNGFKWSSEVYPPQNPAFRVVSKNSRPKIKRPAAVQPKMQYSTKSKYFNTYNGSGPLSIKFVKQIVTTDDVMKIDEPVSQTILSEGNDFTLLPSCNQMKYPNAEFAPLISPFFYADDVYTFFVEPSLTETTVDKWQGYTITRPSQKPLWDEYVVHAPPISAKIPPKYQQEALAKNIPQRDLIDRLALHAINPPVDTLTQPGIVVQFGDAFVGNTGLTQDIGTLSHVITGVGGAFNLKR